MTLSIAHQDVLAELLNIGVGKAASVLNEMIDSHVALSVPSIKIITQDALFNEFRVTEDKRLAAVCLEFSGGFEGATSLIFTTPCAMKLVEALTGETLADDDPMDSVRTGTLVEVGNILINGVMGSIANILDTNIEYQVPNFLEGTIHDLIQCPKNITNAQIILAKTTLEVEKFKVQGDILLYLEVITLSKLISSLQNGE